LWRRDMQQARMIARGCRPERNEVFWQGKIKGIDAHAQLYFG
jgi:hypothetical protein